MGLGCRLAEQGMRSRHLHNAKVVHAVQYDLAGLARAYFRKSQDLARLLLSRRSITFDDQGWTRRKHWAVLVCAWGVIGLAPLALWVDPLWAAPWALTGCGFLLASGQPCRSMARCHWLWGPLSVLFFLGIHLIATAAILTVAVGSFTSWIPWGRRHGASSG